MKYSRFALLSVLVVLVMLFFYFDLQSFLTLESLKLQQQHIEAYRENHPVRAIALYALLYIVVTSLSLPGAAVLTLAGGGIFGTFWGVLIVSFVSTIGATLAFLASRFLFRNWVSNRFGQRLQAIEEGLAQNGAYYLFTLRLIPVFPFFLINLLMGLTAMPTRTFYWVSQLGMLAGTIVYVIAGTQLAQIDSLSGVLSPGLLGSFALIGLFPLITKKLMEIKQHRQIYANWKKPEHFENNLLVIGAGSAGLVSAYIAAAVKAKVTLIEQHKMGGDCLNTGCVPSKALIRTAKFLSELRRSEDFGIQKVEAQFEFQQVMERVQQVIKTIEPHDSVERYTALGVDVLQGTAKIISPWEVTITQGEKISTLTTRSIVICTGARPLIPTIAGLDLIDYLTSDTIWNLRELPKRLLVLGGGPIGCELAQTFSRLGSSVTLVEMAPRLLFREDPDVSEFIEKRFEQEGIAVRVSHTAQQFLIQNGEKVLLASQEGQVRQLPFDQVLLALGRSANISGYGVEKLAIAVSPRKTLETNPFQETNFPNIFAVGDVAGPYQFTHTAAHQAWYAAVNALFGQFKKFKTDYAVIPWSTFTDPEVARVGLNEQEAQQQNRAYELSVYGLDDLDRAITDSSAHGFVKVLTAPGRDTILGVCIVGEHAGDLIAEFVLAMKHGIGLNKILGTIHIYPTLAEANKYVAGVWKRQHAPENLLKLLKLYHAWRRGD